MNEDVNPCITHYLDGVRDCVRRDLHFAVCERDGCEGCVAREAEHGYMCSGCWHRLERATDTWAEFSAAFHDEARAVQPEPGGGAQRPSSSVPLTPLQLAMDAINRFEASRPGALRLWPTTEKGAEDAVRFTRAVENASRAFPIREQPSKIPTTRCPACGRRTLVYQPAPYEGADATVRCLNSECRNIMDHSSFERVALIEAQCCRRCRSDDGCTNLECACHTFAPVPEWQRTSKGDYEPYNPRNPNHAQLREAS